MSYAKLCKYGCQTQIIWDKVQNRFNDNATGEAHTREKCEAAKNRGVTGSQVQDTRVYKVTSPQQQLPQEATKDYVPGDIMATLHIVENLDKKIDNLNIAIAKVMSMIQQAQENNPTLRDNMILKQKVTELEEVIKKREDNFVPANQVPVKKEEGIEYDEHVREMVRKGEQDEELEI